MANMIESEGLSTGNTKMCLTRTLNLCAKRHERISHLCAWLVLFGRSKESSFQATGVTYFPQDGESVVEEEEVNDEPPRRLLEARQL